MPPGRNRFNTARSPQRGSRDYLKRSVQRTAARKGVSTQAVRNQANAYFRGSQGQRTTGLSAGNYGRQSNTSIRYQSAHRQGEGTNIHTGEAPPPRRTKSGGPKMGRKADTIGATGVQAIDNFFRGWRVK